MPQSGPEKSEDPNEALGRWRTLKDASKILNMAHKDLLKAVKHGKIRGTQIGNNWFAYIDRDMAEAASEKARLREEKKQSRRRKVEKLRQENKALRTQIAAGNKKSGKRLKQNTVVVSQPAETSPPALETAIAGLAETQRAAQHCLHLQRYNAASSCSMLRFFRSRSTSKNR